VVVAALAWPAAVRAAEPLALSQSPELLIQFGHSQDVTSVAFLPDGLRVLTGSADGTACLWDVPTSKVIRSYGGGFGSVKAVDFLPEGKLVLTAGGDAVRLWNSETGALLRTFALNNENDKGPEAGRKWRWSLDRVAFSADGKCVIAGNRFDGIRVWDTASGKLRFEYPKEGRKSCNGIAILPDRKQVMVMIGNRAHFFDATTGKDLQSYLLPGFSSREISFSCDGKRMAVVAQQAHTVEFRDVASGKLDLTFRVSNDPASPSIERLALSPDGKQLLTNCFAESKARLWDIQSGKPLQLFDGHTQSIRDFAFSRDARLILTGSRDGTARIWDTATGQALRTFKGRANRVDAMALSPDGKQVLYTSVASTKVCVWNAETGQEMRPLRGGLGRVVSAVFSLDGKHVLTGSVMDGMRLWDVETSRELRTFEGEPSFPAREIFKLNVEDKPSFRDIGFGPRRIRPEFYAVAYSPDGQRVLAGAGGDTAYLWDLKTGRTLQTFVFKPTAAQQTKDADPRGQWDRVCAVAFAPDGEQVLTGGDRGSHLWDAKTGKLLRSFSGDRWGVYAVAYSPDGKLLLTGSGDGTVRIWDAKSGEQRKTLKNANIVYAAVFSPDGKSLVAGGRGNDTRLWDIASEKEVHHFRGHAGFISNIAFSTDGKRLFTGSTDGTTRIWNAESGRELCQVINSDDGALAVTPDNYYLARHDALAAVAFRIGNRAFPFEQFDLKFNRPDLVLKQIGLAPKELVDAYHQAYLKRLKKTGFTEEMLGDDVHLPEITVAAAPPLSTLERSLSLKIKARDGKYRLDRLLALVNGVAIGGSKGIDLRERKTSEWDGSIDVELSAGKNVIQVSTLNEKGVESLRETFHVNCEVRPAKPRVFAVVVGVSEYQDARRRLDYAAKDAKDLADFLEKNPTRFGESKVLRCIDKDATREQILKAKELLQQAGVDDLVIVFFAGHGLLDKELDYRFASVDVDLGDPTKRGVAYAEIEGLLDCIKARRKLLLMDTCHSGEVDKEEVLAAGPHKVTEGTVQARGFRGVEVRQARLGTNHSAELMREMFTDLRRGTGAVAVAAAGGLQYALESKEWQNGVFTYALLRGLGGAADKNKDGKVQVSELRDYVLEEVRRLTDGRQAPTVRRENLDFDFPLDSAAR
jgi:WD40 repeat protein